MQLSKKSRSREKHLEESRGRTGPKRAQAGRPSPFQARFGTPFDLGDPRAIYSPRASSHASSNSSSAAEEQRREGHPYREERVEMVD